MSDFEFFEEDVIRLWKIFIRIDKSNRGYISIGQLFTHLSERSYSIVAPYLERLFDLIDREEVDKCTFEELLPALVSFCLFSKDEMVNCKHCKWLIMGCSCVQYARQG